MNFKQSTVGEIIESEREMVLTGTERYGEYFINASEFDLLLNEFIKSVDPERFIFAMFLSQIRKHTMLAIFSAVRLHHVQAMMNLRQVLEAGSCAAYAIANIGKEDFADIDKNGFLDPSQDLTNKRYEWLKENYSTGSTAILNMKNTINKLTAHSNIVIAYNNFGFDEKLGKFSTPYFDIEDEFWVKTDLWQIGNIVMGLMDLFYGVNKKLDVIKFGEDFIPRLKQLEVQNNKLKSELMNADRFKKMPILNK